MMNREEYFAKEHQVELLEQWKDKFKGFRQQFEGEAITNNSKEIKVVDKLIDILIECEQYCEEEMDNLTSISNEELWTLKENMDYMEVAE